MGLYRKSFFFVYVIDLSRNKYFFFIIESISDHLDISKTSFSKYLNAFYNALLVDSLSRKSRWWWWFLASIGCRGIKIVLVQFNLQLSISYGIPFRMYIIGIFFLLHHHIWLSSPNKKKNTFFLVLVTSWNREFIVNFFNHISHDHIKCYFFLLFLLFLSMFI